MLKCNVVEFNLADACQPHWLDRTRLLRCVQNIFEVFQRDFGLTVDIDHVSNFLERTEDEKGVDEQGEELTDRYLLGIYQVQHHEHDAGPQRIHRGPLNEAETPQVAHLLQLEFQNLARRAIQPLDLLLCKAEAFHQLDIPQ